jgi:hypothetical protein
MCFIRLACRCAAGSIILRHVVVAASGAVGPIFLCDLQLAANPEEPRGR